MLDYDVHNNSISPRRPAPLAARRPLGRAGLVPLANVYSVGDLLIGVGIVLAIVVAMRPTTGRRAPEPEARESRN